MPMEMVSLKTVELKDKIPIMVPLGLENANGIAQLALHILVVHRIFLRTEFPSWNNENALSL